MAAREKVADKNVATTELAAVLGISARRVQQLAQELKNGLEIRPSKKVGAGFRLAAKDGSGYFDCSDQEIAEMLMPFFRDMHL